MVGKNQGVKKMHKSILILSIYFGFLWKCIIAENGMPLIQINHEGTDYPEMREEVHLDDFFWTGSGDGPPEYLKKVHTNINKGKDVIVKTETVVATVYVDGNNEVDIPICLDCPPDDGGGGGTFNGVPPLNYSATDRRYWLLTVMSGFYSLKDNPTLEEKLSKLYRLAFTRQQSKHLGINGAQQIYGSPVNRDRREYEDTTVIAVSTTEGAHLDPKTNVEMFDLESGNDGSNVKPPNRREHTTRDTEFDSSSSEEIDSSTLNSIIESEPETFELQITTGSPVTSPIMEPSTAEASYVTVQPWELIQSNAKMEKQQEQLTVSNAKPKMSRQLQLQLLQAPLFRNQQVRVVIHNITQISEEDVKKRNIASFYDEDINDKIDDRPIANQTELIYSVLVNGRPVLAVTAANDMRLVTNSEAAAVIGSDVFMKSEPYLREPQATPLAPATRSGSIGFLDSIRSNPILVIVSSIAIFLLLLLLVGLLLMGRSRMQQKHVETTRTTSRDELLRPDSSLSRSLTSRNVVTNGQSSRGVGILRSNESETVRKLGEPRIHFPGPPPADSRRNSLTSSTDNTSDSSLYCPLNPPNADVQRILDEKAASLFNKDKRRNRHQLHHKYDRAEGREDAVYSTVISEKKRDKSRLKAKRRYLSANRVGSLEASPTATQQNTNWSGDENVTDSIDEGDGLQPKYENFEQNEAFNAQNNYHRNKILSQHAIGLDQDRYGRPITAEAINKEIIRTLQPADKSSDTGSIGSFLSMASVRAFPKSKHPEPLNRVLEPVFVTYYDNAEDAVPTVTGAVQKASSTSKLDKPKRTQQKRRPAIHKTDLNSTYLVQTHKTIENFPLPKAPPKSTSFATQSDNPDPGVIGPVVWERHKKFLSQEAEIDDLSFEYCKPASSPLHDPAALQTHYEDLLEGALKIHSKNDDLPMPLPTRDFTSNRHGVKRLHRGSSAGVAGNASKSFNFEGRPATAQPEKTPKSNQSTLPPSPSSGAWGGSSHGSYSPLVRPFSAGFFESAPSTSFSVSGRSRYSEQKGERSAAPLIEAIQNELRKYQEEKN